MTEAVPAPVWPKGIAAITLFVSDLGSARAFYQNFFGLTVIFEDPVSVVFKLGGSFLNLLHVSAADELVSPAQVASAGVGARFVLTIEVEDVDAKCAELASRGVTLLNGPIDRPWGIRTASFTDPDGYIWEIAK
ncbi:MAG: VOC family protein [Candidatus Eisenbacteria bacterium]|nr:VOC family protein [Candidatus Eisenbacteria bacterium]